MWLTTQRLAFSIEAVSVIGTQSANLTPFSHHTSLLRAYGTLIFENEEKWKDRFKTKVNLSYFFIVVASYIIAGSRAVPLLQ